MSGSTRSKAFLDPTIKRSMPDPHADGNAGGSRAHRRRRQRGETIAIFGDYDVDGTTSSALLARFCGRPAAEPMIHIPDRLFEGYGPNVEAVRALAGRGATLLSRSIAARPASSRWRGTRSASMSALSIITRATGHCRPRWRS
jgi:single-stranded-DNA-specific exonuclease